MSLQVNGSVRPPFLPGTSSALSSRLQSFEKTSSTESSGLILPRRSSSMGSVDTSLSSAGPSAVVPSSSSSCSNGVVSTKPKEGLVSQIASRFQSPPSAAKEEKPPLLSKKPEISLLGKVERTQSHMSRFNHARAMFEAMGGSTEDILEDKRSQAPRSGSNSPPNAQEEARKNASNPSAPLHASGQVVTSSSSSAIKELTNKQRNWFSHFEKGRETQAVAAPSGPAPEIPNGNASMHEEGGGRQAEKAVEKDGGDVKDGRLEKRVLSARNSTASSTDSIDDYIRNWRKNSSSEGETPIKSPPPEERLKHPERGSSEVLNAVTRILENESSGHGKPALSPKPPPDIVKRLSFNGKRPERPGSHCSSASSSSDEHAIVEDGTLVKALAVRVREEGEEEESTASNRLSRELLPTQNGRAFAQGMIYDASLDDLKSDKILDGPNGLLEEEEEEMQKESLKPQEDSSSDFTEEDPITVVHKSPSVSSVTSSLPQIEDEEEEEVNTHISPLTETTTANGNGSSLEEEYTEELQFDATISSGHLGFKEEQEGAFRSTPIKLGMEDPKASPLVIEEMTPKEADMLLSSNLVEKRLTDDQAREVVRLLSPEEEEHSEEIFVAKAASEALDKLDNLVYQSDVRPETPPPPKVPEEEESIVLIKDPASEVYFDECTGVHYLDDGHYWFEIDGIDPSSALDGSAAFYKPPGRLNFSKAPIRQFSTHSIDDYDRRNEDIDPVAASAEYELEKRVEKMDTFDVELRKGPEGLGLSIIGMGVGADTGLEKLGVFVKTVTQGGPAMGQIKVNDLIIEVDGNSLVGVTQAYASSVLQNTSGVIRFLIGRDKDPENSEVAQLIRQSLQADMDRAERQRHAMSHMESYDSSEPTSVVTNSSTVEGEHTIQEEEEVGLIGRAVSSSSSSPDDSISPDNKFDLLSDPKGQKLKSDITILKRRLEEAQYRNMAIEAEMEEMRSKLAKDSQSREEQQIQTERTHLTESGIQTSLPLEDQEKSKDLERKYAHAKRIIHELKEHEQFLALQLQERDQGYHSHLKLLIDRVIQLENELASTQKYAGIPISLPYNHDGNNLLSPPELLKRKPVLPENAPSLDISDDNMNNKDIKEEFDSAIPAHELLDIRANKFKAELATKGAMMSQRHRPTPDALRSNVLKRSISAASASSFQTTDSFELDQESNGESREATPDSDSGYMAATTVMVSTKTYNKPLPPLPSAPLSPNKNPNFLAEMNSAVMRRQEQKSSQATKGGSAAAVSLADQLKSSLEERRKASNEAGTVPEDLVADIKQAVKIANDNEFRNATAVSSSVPQSNAAASTTSSPPSRSPPEQQLQQPSETSSSKNGANQAWSANPVEEWAKEQVCQWLLALGMESYITLFMDKTITGAALLNFDSNGLKELGIKSKEDREKIKKKIKELKAHNDKECKRDGHKKENFLKKAFNKK